MLACDYNFLSMELWVFHVLLLILTNLSDCDRIPRTVLPIKYDLTLTPYFETELDSYFKGNLVFKFKPLKHNQIRRVAAHADGLEVNSVVMLESGKSVMGQQPLINDSANQLIYFDYGYPLSVDKDYELHINYSGTISSNDGWGLYKGDFTHEGKKRFYAVTQLRPVFARRLFPCLDEPIYKAHFTVRVWRLPQYTARSNMPLLYSSPQSLTTGRILDTFAETPPMSTFLLALAVFDFSSLISDGGKFTSWTVPANLPFATHGHRAVPRLVRVMEAIAGCELPLPKMDQIALPRLNPVAMENWGINTYRESNMLYKEGKDPPIARQNVPRFIGHEVSHQWLGNLVTLEWWSSLWLSEMYAMYYEYYLPSQIEPSWKMDDQMVVSLVLPGLLADSFNTSKPLTTNVSTNQEIMAMFSGLTYTKGPALLRMVNGILSHPRTDQALQQLIQEKKYKNVRPSELWEVYGRFGEGLPADMETIMRSWTDQPGYPLISVTVKQSEGIATLHQERFLLECSSNDQSLWWIPLTFTSGNNPNFTNTNTRVWLSPRIPSTTIRVERHIGSWIIFNLQYIGFYRVNYNLPNWERLIDTLLTQPFTIHELNRVQLLDDSWTLARAGRLPYSVALRLSSYLTHEFQYTPWAAFIPAAEYVIATFNSHPFQETLLEYMRYVVGPVFTHLGFYQHARDSHLVEMTRVQVVTFACSIGLPACVLAAQTHEDQITRGKQTLIPPGLEFRQLCTVLEYGKPSTNWTHKIALLSDQDQAKVLPCVKDKSYLTRYLTTSLQQDSSEQWRSKVTTALSRPANIDPVFSFVVDNYQQLLVRFGSANVANYFSDVGTRLTTKSHLDKIKDLTSRKNYKDTSQTMEAVKSALEGRLKWIENNISSLQGWVEDFLRIQKKINVLS